MKKAAKLAIPLAAFAIACHPIPTSRAPNLCSISQYEKKFFKEQMDSSSCLLEQQAVDYCRKNGVGMHRITDFLFGPAGMHYSDSSRLISDLSEKRIVDCSTFAIFSALVLVDCGFDPSRMSICFFPPQPGQNVSHSTLKLDGVHYQLVSIDGKFYLGVATDSGMVRAGWTHRAEESLQGAYGHNALGILEEALSRIQEGRVGAQDHIDSLVNRSMELAKTCHQEDGSNLINVIFYDAFDTLQKRISR